MSYTIVIYIIFGLLPSLIWLAYYLSRDLHPEPKRMILEIFLWGAFITLPVFFIQLGFAYLLTNLNLNKTISDILYWFFVIAFTEEFFKYFVVRIKIFNSLHLDEPLDIMLYMVVSALGFAAVENILYLFAPVGSVSFDDFISRTLIIALIRFVGSTFLHTLCSALIGYFLAMFFYEVKKRYSYLLGGILIATLAHGVYDYSLMTLDGYIQIIIPAVVILLLASVVFYGFGRLKKLDGLCKTS